MNMLPDEKELIRGLNAGSSRSHEIIYERYFPRLIVYAYNIIENEDHAQDIASETIIKIFGRRDYFSSLSHLEGFLYITARNASINYLRDQKNFKTLTRQYIPDIPDEFDKWDLVNAQLDGAMLETIYQAIERLPERSRQVIDLLFIQKLSYAKAAEIMETTPKNIENMRAYALKKLYQDLSGKIDPKDLAAVIILLSCMNLALL